MTGAFGAHGLKKKTGITTDNIHAWETASHYAVCCVDFYHMLSILTICVGFQWPCVAIGIDAPSVRSSQICRASYCCGLDNILWQHPGFGFRPRKVHSDP